MSDQIRDHLERAWSPAARLDWNLENWRRYRLTADDQVTKGAPTRAAGCVGGGYVSDSESPYICADVASAEKVEGCVASLPGAHRSAIEHRYLGSKYLGAPTYEIALAGARIMLAELFRARGVL